MTIYTIGHSNHDFDAFAALLALHAIDAVADLRSSPFSVRQPQFDQPLLRQALQQRGITYVFLGDSLGGRPAAHLITAEGYADYERMASLPVFRSGVDRILRGAERYSLAMMCSEAEPSECHRALLVGREIATRGAGVVHILRDGSLETQAALEHRLLDMARLAHEDFFSPPETRLSEAYRHRASRVAWRIGIAEDAA